MLHLPRKIKLRCCKCCTCHAKMKLRCCKCCAECCACHAKTNLRCSKPATQNEAAPKSITRRQTSANLYEGAQSAAPATQNELEMLQVLRLPRKTRRRPKASSSLVARFPPTSMKVLQVLALATQNEPEVLQVLRLPRQNKPEMLQVLRLPRKTRRRPKASLVARFPPTSKKVLQVLRLPCK